VKNNLGRLDLPSLRYRIDESFINTDDGQANVGKLVWLGTSDRSVADIMREGNGGDREERAEIEQFIESFMTDGTALAADVIQAGKKHGFSKSALDRARKNMGITTKQHGFGKDSCYVWSRKEPAPTTDPTDPASLTPGPVGSVGTVTTEPVDNSVPLRYQRGEGGTDYSEYMDESVEYRRQRPACDLSRPGRGETTLRSRT